MGNSKPPDLPHTSRLATRFSFYGQLKGNFTELYRDFLLSSLGWPSIES
ncbi:unnamed protein product [Callosobruchus maculatus]|uniref:Uncharacterized protein n=1 Tax=Callosobruchus maculatus TaxID=64391 RepID=A0A653CB42_CALMS|nr:unnamed protein product [Callosobruchus maculatus]